MTHVCPSVAGIQSSNRELKAYRATNGFPKKTNNWKYDFLIYFFRGVCMFFSLISPLMKLKGEEVKRSFFLAYPSLPLPTAWLTDWPAVKGAFVSALWRKANQILRLVCLREENGAPGMPSAAEMCRQSDCWGRLGLLWPFQNYAGGITCLAPGHEGLVLQGPLVIYLFIHLNLMHTGTLRNISTP